MKTFEEVKSEILAVNPSRKYIINGEEFEQTDAEFNEAVENRAKMILQQQQELADKEALRQTKIAAYQKLGLTEAEIEALLPSPKPTEE